jgi:hypothetical protein
VKLRLSLPAFKGRATFSRRSAAVEYEHNYFCGAT